MEYILNTMETGVQALTMHALAIASALAIAGTLAMAILQTIKDITPARRWWQAWWIKRWFVLRVTAFSKEAMFANMMNASPDERDFSPELDEESALVQLLELATGGEKNAFFDLPIEQIVAQMNAAAQIALDYPHKYFSVLAILSQGSEIGDVRDVMRRAAEREAGQGQYSSAGLSNGLDARNRIGHRIQRNLDGFQIAMGSRWKFLMQILSIGLTTMIVVVAMNQNNDLWNSNSGANGWMLFYCLLLGIAGGYLAPVARDLVAALQNIRKG